METIILCAMFGAFILISFFFGIKVGMMVPKDTKILNNEKIKKSKPIKNNEFNMNENNDELNDELDEVAKIMYNIEVYNGTAEGQVDV